MNIVPAVEPVFDGVTYDPALDSARLKKQLGRVFEIMSDGCWHSLDGLKRNCQGWGAHDTESAISARLRDLRKPRFGGYDVERRRDASGHWLYRLRTEHRRSAMHTTGA